MKDLIKSIAKKTKLFVFNKPCLFIMIITSVIFGLAFICMGSIRLLFRFIAQRPLFNFSIYIIILIVVSCLYSIYAKAKNKEISNEAFNQITKDLSHVIKNVLLVWISAYMATYMATKVITVYFSNTRIQYGGVLNTYYIGQTPIPEEVKYPESTKGKTGKVSEIVTTEPEHPEKETTGKQKIIIKEAVSVKVPNIRLSQEYPSSQNYQYTQSIDLSSHKPAVMTLSKDEQPMWFGIGNVGLFNISNPMLFLKFDGTFNIMTKPNESLGWSTMDPNREFNIKINSDLQPGSAFRLNPLFVKFPRAGEYRGSYTITSDNNLPVTGTFVINVAE